VQAHPHSLPVPASDSESPSATSSIPTRTAVPVPDPACATRSRPDTLTLAHATRFHHVRWKRVNDGGRVPKRKKKESATVRVLITSSDGNLPAAISALKKQGLKVDNVMDAIGVATGEVAEHMFEAMQKTPGVTVEREGSVQIPPPDSPIQ
jgi:hypothetical protein